MVGRLYPFGYGSAYKSKEDADEVHNGLTLLMRDPRTILLDIRHTPTGHPSYTQEALKAMYGKQYKHAWRFGNVNHAMKGAPIKLADPSPDSPTMKVVLDALKAGRSFVLLCSCVKYEKCHRKVVEELIRKTAAASGLILEDPGTILDDLPDPETLTF